MRLSVSATVAYCVCRSGSAYRPAINNGTDMDLLVRNRIVFRRTLRPNSITLSWSQTGPKLVADLQRAGIWPIIWLASSELARASRSATRFEPVCDQDSVMEFGLDQLRTGLRPGSSYLDMSHLSR